MERADRDSDSSRKPVDTTVELTPARSDFSSMASAFVRHVLSRQSGSTRKNESENRQVSGENKHEQQ